MTCLLTRWDPIGGSASNDDLFIKKIRKLIEGLIVWKAHVLDWDMVVRHVFSQNNNGYCYQPTNVPWWRHQMETFSALLALCAGNSPVPGEFPTQRPVTRSFDVYFDLRPNKRLSKQSWGWWFGTPSRPLWRHRIATVGCCYTTIQCDMFLYMMLYSTTVTEIKHNQRLPSPKAPLWTPPHARTIVHCASLQWHHNGRYGV